MWWMWLLACGDPSTPQAPVDTGVVEVVDTGEAADTGREDTGALERTSVVVAQGHLGRRLRSLDGGRTWQDDQSADPTAECWSPVGPECDHTETTARGIAYGDGAFVATYGWGYPGGLVRSEDGATWTEVLPDTTGAGVAYGQGTFLVGDWGPWRSTDGGRTWNALDWAVDHNVRRTVWLDVDGGRFALVNDGPLVVSADLGDTWTAPPAPAGCASGAWMLFEGGLMAGNGVVVGVHPSGSTCVSDDGLASFAPGPTLGVAELTTRLTFDGTAFAVWSAGVRHHSTDGSSWTATPTEPALDLDQVVWVPVEDVYVGVSGAYGSQRFWWSLDGVSWTEGTAPPDAHGHPITDLAVGSLP